MECIRELHDVLFDDAPRADVLVAYLAVAHHAVGQTHVVAAGMNLHVRVRRHQTVVDGFASKMDGVGVVPLWVWIGPPSVADDENDGTARGPLQLLIPPELPIADCQLPIKQPTPQWGRLAIGNRKSTIHLICPA